MRNQKIYPGIPLLIGFLLLYATNGFSQDSNFYIFLCFGQSNMEGQGAIEEIDKTVDNRFQLIEAINCPNLGRTKGSWYTAAPPLCRCYSGLTPVDYFGRTMILNLPENIKVGIVHVAVAGSKIELFDKDNYGDYVATAPSWMLNIINEYGGNPYAHLVEIARLAQNDGVIKGILLHQGESNTGDAAWPSKVKGVYDNLIADLGLNAAEVPLLAGEVVNADQGGVCASMNLIIATLPQTITNSHVISSSGCTDGPDNLHFNSAGYRELGMRYATKMLSLLGYNVNDLEYPEIPSVSQGTDSVYLEAECATIGSTWDIRSDAGASHESYVTVKSGTESISAAPTDIESHISFPFTIKDAGTFNLFARLNCATANDDSFWIKMDNGDFVTANGLTTAGWQWLNLNNYSFTTGSHTLTIAYREDGAQLDKICIANFSTPPTNMGYAADNCITVGVDPVEQTPTFALGQNFPNPFVAKTVIPFEIPTNSYVSVKIFNMLGVEIAALGNKKFASGKHILEFTPEKLSTGCYFYMLKADKFSATKKMIILNE